jgi:hypothetical protein
MEMDGGYPDFQILPDFDAFDLLNQADDEFLADLDIETIIRQEENKEKSSKVIFYRGVKSVSMEYRANTIY